MKIHLAFEFVNSASGKMLQYGGFCFVSNVDILLSIRLRYLIM